MLLFWRLFAALVLIISIVVHVSAFCGIDPLEKFPRVMLIHLLIFVPIIGFLCYDKKERLSRPEDLPRYAMPVIGVLFVYALVNFFLFFFRSEGGGPHQRDGKFVLSNDGVVIRELTEEEFHQHQTRVVRGVSGHWMLFAFLWLMIFTGIARRRQPYPRFTQGPFADADRSNH